MLNMNSCWFSSFQALKYPYFHVGHTLGAPLKHPEQHRQEKEPEAATEPKHLSLCRTDLDLFELSKSRSEPQSCSQLVHQPLQQIRLPQVNSGTPTEGQKEPLSLVKNRQPGSSQGVGITQVHIVHVRPTKKTKKKEAKLSTSCKDNDVLE